MVDPFAIVEDEPVEDLVDSVEAAALIGITVNNLRQLVHHKKLPVAYRRGRRVVYHRADVLRLAEDRRR